MALLGNKLNFASILDNSGLRRGVVDAEGIIRSFAGKISKEDVFGGLALGGVMALKKIATTAFESSQAYQTSMFEIQTISKATQQDFEGMSAAIQDVGLDVPQTSDELAKAFYQIASAGYDGSQGIDLLTISAKAAVAGITDTETAADGLTTIMNAWKLPMSEAENVTDQLFNTVRLGKTTFPELANNMSQVGAQAAAMGIPLDEVLAAVATMTKQGTPTAQAFTQIRAALISTSDVLGDGWSKTMTFQEGLQAMSDKAGGSETKLKDMTGRVEAMNAILQLTGDNAQMAASDLNELGNSTGAATDAFNIMIESAENQSKLLGANIEAAFRPLGDFILKNFTDITTFLNEAFESGDLEKFAKIVGVATSGLVAYKTATALSSISMMDLKRGLVVARTAMKSLNLAVASNPIGLIAAAVAAAAAAFVLFKSSINSVSASFKEFNAELIKEKTELNNVFEALKKANVGTDARKELIKKANETYGKYLPNLLTEKSSLNDITIAQAAANKGLERNIALKAKEKAIEEAVADAVESRASATSDIISRATKNNKSLTKQVADEFNNLVQIGIEYDNADAAGKKKMYAAKQKAEKDFNEKYLAGRVTYLEAEKNILSISILEAVKAERDKNAAILEVDAMYSGFLSENKKKEYELSYEKLYQSREKELITEERFLELKAQLDEKYKKKEVSKNKKTKSSSLTPTNTKEPKLNYYDKLTKSLQDAQKELMNLSGTQSDLDYQAIADQQIKIEKLKTEIDTQEQILGLKELSNKQDESNVTQAAQIVEVKEEEIQKTIEIWQLDNESLSLMRKALKEELSGLDKKSKEYKDLAKLKKEADNENLMRLSDSLNLISFGLSEIGEALGSINGQLGESLQQAGELASSAANIFSSIASGDYLKAGIQAATSIISVIGGAINKKNEYREAQIEAENAAFQRQIDLLKIIKGLETYSAYDSILAGLNSQLDAAKAHLQALLQVPESFSSDVNAEIAAQIAATEAEIFDLESQMRDVGGEFQEALTGTTSSSITDSILTGFQNGKFAAEDFADDFEGLMKNAMLESFKLKFLESQFDNFYTAFGAAAESDGGLSEAELLALQQQFNANIEQAQSGFESMNQLFEGTFGSSITDSSTSAESSQGLAGSISASLTEETGTVLAGTLNSIRIFVATQNEILEDMQTSLKEISFNTSYNSELQRLQNIESLLQQQIDNTRSAGI